MLPKPHADRKLPSLAIWCLCPFFCLASRTPAPAQHLQIRSAGDVVENWDKDQHLYVKGDLGLPDAALQEFETWLDANAPNWTIVLMHSAEGESFRAQDGTIYSGSDAVEFQLGERLPAVTGFGKLVQAESGKRNGAIFVLLLQERHLLYFAGDLYDSYGVGESRWIGNLDRAAIDAMRSGGRIIDAAKDTVTTIDSLLARRIIAEKNERERDREAARATIEGVEKLLAYSQEKAEGLLPPEASGDLSENRSEIEWKQQLGLARDALNQGKFAEAKTTATSLESKVRARLKVLDDYRLAAGEMDGLEQQISGFSPHPESDAAAAQINSATMALREARTSHRRGESAYSRLLGEAAEALDLARAENRATLARLEEIARAEKFRRKVMLIATIAAILILAVVLLVMNRRRKPWKTRAGELLAQWDREMAARRDALFGLLDRTNLVVGSSGGADDGSLEGETLRLGQETVRDVDALFIMSSGVDTIIDQAESLLKTANPLRWLANLFLSGNYRRAVRLLSDEPVVFSPDEPLQLIIRGRGAKQGSQEDQLLGKIEDQKPFSLTFNELLAEFGRRAERALVAVDLLETSWEQIADRLAGLSAAEDSLDDAGAANALAAGDTGLFSMPSLARVLVPAVDSGLAGAEQAGRKDPVEALRTWIPATQSQIDDGLALCQLAERTRADSVPALGAASDQLGKLGRLHHWIEDFLLDYSDAADELAELAADEDVSDKIQALGESIQKLCDDAAKAVELAGRADTPAPQSVAEARKSVAALRRMMARKLGIQVRSLLAEDADVDPTQKLEEAQTHITAAQAAIDRGGVLAAEAGLNECDRLVAEAGELVHTIGEEFAAHPGKLEEQRKENSRLVALAQERDAVLKNLKARYSLTAIQTGVTDKGESRSLIDNVSMANNAINEAATVMNHSQKAHGSGRVLEGAAELRRAADLHGDALRLLDQITEHADQIAKIEKSNRRALDILKMRAESTRDAVENPKIMVPTRKLFADALDSLSRAEEAISPAKGKPDPFAAAEDVSAATAAFDQVDASAEDDRRSHAEASKSLNDAGAQLDVASRCVREADTDKLPDSRAITEAADNVKRLLADYGRVAERLEIAHENWLEIDAEADRIGTEAARAAAILRSELDEASGALAAIKRAASSVQSASGWRGSHGVRILGEPGIALLHAAREFLRSGNYKDAIQHAGQALREASGAVADAEAEVARKKREKRRREEEARRRRMQRSTSSSTFGGSRSSSSRRSGGSSSISRSSSSSSSRSTSRSSFRSGSGFSRSSW